MSTVQPKLLNIAPHQMRRERQDKPVPIVKGPICLIQLIHQCIGLKAAGSGRGLIALHSHNYAGFCPRHQALNILWGKIALRVSVPQARRPVRHTQWQPEGDIALAGGDLRRGMLRHLSRKCSGLSECGQQIYRYTEHEKGLRISIGRGSSGTTFQRVFNAG